MKTLQQVGILVMPTTSMNGDWDYEDLCFAWRLLDKSPSGSAALPVDNNNEFIKTLFILSYPIPSPILYSLDRLMH